MPPDPGVGSTRTEIGSPEPAATSARAGADVGVGTDTDSTMGWIAAQGGPARSLFRLSALAEVAGTCALIVQWALLGMGIAVWMGGAEWSDGAEWMAGAVLPWFAGAALAAPVRLLLRVLAARLAERGRDRVTEAIRVRLVPVLLAEAGRTRASDAADALIGQAPIIGGYLAGSQPLRLAAVPSTLLILVAVAVVHWPVAVLLALCTALLPLNLRLAGAATVTAGERQLAASRRLSAIVTESVRGLPTLRSLRAVDRRRAVLESASRRLERSTLTVLTFAFLSGAVMDVAVTFAIAVSATYTGLVLLGFVALPGSPALGLGGALFVLLLCPAYFAPAQRAARGFHDRDDALVAARAILEASGGAVTAREANGAEDRTTEKSAGSAVSSGAEDSAVGSPDGFSVAVMGPSIDLRDVTVTDEDTVVLDGIDLSIPAAEWTAISGPSGAGKTTLLHLVAGRRTPSAGTILRSAEDTAPGLTTSVSPTASAHPTSAATNPTAPASLSAKYATPVVHGWLGSDTVILDGTIAENIGLGSPTIGSDRIRAALGASGLDHVLAELPDGIDTVLGSEGRTLSAGERRRIAIARLIASDRRLWVLDEPTAHLDRATETEILRTLRRVSVGRTVVIATHSTTVVEIADHAHELRAGTLTSEDDGA